MKIKTKFNIEQKVFFIYEGNILNGKIESIFITKYGIIYYIKYKSKVYRSQKEIFTSFEEAIQYWLHKQKIKLYK